MIVRGDGRIGKIIPLYACAILISVKLFALLSFPVLGYLSGSIPFAVWIARYVGQIDLRDAGSGHAGATNTARHIGFGWGALVLLLDLAKGFIPTFLAIKYAEETWAITLTAALAVIGHCWPVFAQFRGGMGLATFGGALLAANWLSFLVGLSLLILILLLLRHRARASLLLGLLIAPVFWFFNFRGVELWIALAGGIVIAYRFVPDWNRKYQGL